MAMRMDLTDTQRIFRRCKDVNCVMAGQSISIGLFDSEFGSRDLATVAMDSMIASDLLSKGIRGNYVLTAAGAQMLSELASVSNGRMPSQSRQFPRPPINKL